MPQTRLLPNEKLLGAFVGLATLVAFRDLLSFDPSPSFPSFDGPVEEWTFSLTGESPLLILAITAWFVFRRAPGIARSSATGVATSLGAGGILWAMTAILWARYASAFQVLPLSLAVLILATGLFLGGRQGARVFALPAVFIALLGTPWPTPLTHFVIFPLQIFTAESAALFIRMLGYPVQQSGDLVIAQWATFKVIETCAGLRSMQTLTMAAFVYGELMGSPTRRRIVLILSAPLLGMLINVARVVFLVFTTTLESELDHTRQGIVMIVVGVFLLWGLDEAIDRLPPKKRRTGEAAPPQASAPTKRFRLAALLVALLMTSLITAQIDPWQPSRGRSRSVHSIPRVLGEWEMRGRALPVDEEYLGSVRFSSRTFRRYERDGQSVSLFAGSNERLQRNAGVVSEKTKLLAPGYFLAGDATKTLGEESKGFQEFVVRRAGDRSLLVHHRYEGISSLPKEILRSVLGLDRGPLRRADPERVFRIATEIEAQSDGRARARARLRDFAVQLDRSLTASE